MKNDKDEHVNDKNNSVDMTDEDIITLLEGFGEMKEIEQHNLIKFLEALEKENPERVKRLREMAKIE